MKLETFVEQLESMTERLKDIAFDDPGNYYINIPEIQIMTFWMNQEISLFLTIHHRSGEDPGMDMNFRISDPEQVEIAKNINTITHRIEDIRKFLNQLGEE